MEKASLDGRVNTEIHKRIADKKREKKPSAFHPAKEGDREQEWGEKTERGNGQPNFSKTALREESHRSTAPQTQKQSVLLTRKQGRRYRAKMEGKTKGTRAGDTSRGRFTQRK